MKEKNIIHNITNAVLRLSEQEIKDINNNMPEHPYNKTTNEKYRRVTK
jgi:hypothetical protein